MTSVRLLTVMTLIVMGSSGELRNVTFSPAHAQYIEINEEAVVRVVISADVELVDIICRSEDTTLFSVISVTTTRNGSRVHTGIQDKLDTTTTRTAEVRTTRTEPAEVRHLTAVVKLRGHYFGRASLVCELTSTLNSRRMEQSFNYCVIVLRTRGVSMMLFKVLANVILIVINLAMGCELDIKVVKESLARPIAPLIGFFCQFICMPLISLFVIYINSLKGAFAFGLFTLGCAPGGGKSNYLTYIFGGNVSLSLTMTFISNVAALVMMPIWLLTIGNDILTSNHVVDPDDNALDIDIRTPLKFIVLSILLNTGPLIIGVIISKFRTSLADKIRKLLNPILIFSFIFFFFGGIYIHMDTIVLITIERVYVCMSIPYIGFAIGLSLATLTYRNRADSVCICLETGVQNISVAIVICVNTLSNPEEEEALFGLMIIAVFSYIPVYVLLVIMKLRKCITSNKEDVPVDDSDRIESTNNL